MTTKTSKKWLVDLKNMTCCNTENQILVAFRKRGPALEGEIINMPYELVEKLSTDPNREIQIRKAVIEADEAFFKAYFNREIERKDLTAPLAG